MEDSKNEKLITEYASGLKVGDVFYVSKKTGKLTVLRDGNPVLLKILEVVRFGADGQVVTTEVTEPMARTIVQGQLLQLIEKELRVAKNSQYRMAVFYESHEAFYYRFDGLYEDVRTEDRLPAILSGIAETLPSNVIPLSRAKKRN